MTKILFFEDEEGPAYFMIGALKRFGYEVDRATEVEKAIENVERFQEYDIAILDIKGKNYDDGIVLAEELRKNGIKIPILFSSASAISSDDQLLNRLKSINNSKLIMRPHSNHSLLHEVREMLGGP